MSLVNDMLRDLEQRRNKEAQQKPVSVPTTTARPRRKKYVKLVGGGLLVCAATLIVVAGWFFLSYPQTIERPGAASRVTAVADSQVAKPIQPLSAMTQQGDQAIPLVADSQPLLSAIILVEQEDQLLLELMFSHLPDQAEIRSGAGEGRVSIMLQNTHIKPGLVLPQPQMEQVSGISLLPTVTGLELIVAIRTHEQPTTTQSVEPRADKLRIGLNFPASPEVFTPVVVSEPTVVVPEPDSLPQPKSQAEVLPAIVRSSPPIETDEYLYQRGLRSLQSGDPAAAQQSFTAALRINPKRLAARLELVAVLQNLGDEQGVLDAIREGLEHEPNQPDLRKLYAHHLILVQRYSEAQRVIEREPLPALKDDPDYHALRAAMYQELGEYARAAEVYVQLLEQRPREPLWWMGLAIALEQQGLNGGARDAYRTALDVRGLRPDLENFVRERLQYL